MLDYAWNDTLNVYHKVMILNSIFNKIKNILVLSSVTFFMFASVFAVTRGENPSMAELSFAEESHGYVGSVVPASCESNPPKEHFAGDCPVSVRVLMDAVYGGVTVNITDVTSGFSETKLGTNSWQIGTLAEDNSSHETGVTVHYTSSGGSTECWYRGMYKGPANGSFQTYIRDGGVPSSFSINCTDGVHWSGPTFVTLVGSWNYQEPECSNCDD